MNLVHQLKKIRKFFGQTPPALYLSLSETHAHYHFTKTGETGVEVYAGSASLDQQHAFNPLYLDFVAQTISKISQKYSRFDIHCSLSLGFLHHVMFDSPGDSVAKVLSKIAQKDPSIFDKIPAVFKNSKIQYKVVNLPDRRDLAFLLLATTEKNLNALTNALEKSGGNLIYLGCTPLDFVAHLQARYAQIIVRKSVCLLYCELQNNQVKFYFYFLKQSKVFFNEIYLSKIDQSLLKVMQYLSPKALQSPFWIGFLERFIVTFEPILGFYLKKKEDIHTIISASEDINLHQFSKLLEKYTKIKCQFAHHTHNLPASTSESLSHISTCKSAILQSLQTQNFYTFKTNPLINFRYQAQKILMQNFIFQKISFALTVVFFLVSTEFLLGWMWSAWSYQNSFNEQTRQNQIRQTTKEIQDFEKKNKILKQKIQTFQNSSYFRRPNASKFLNQLPLVVPEGVILSVIEISSQTLKVEGYSKNRKRIYELEKLLSEKFEFISRTTINSLIFKENFHYFDLSIEHTHSNP